MPSFTVSASGLLRVLSTPVQIGPAFDPATKVPPFRNYLAIWDTGATSSVITERVIAECNLKPIGMTRAHGADGEYNTEVYLISVVLLNGVAFHILRVTKGKLPDGSDVLVGMDVISRGDLAVTNLHGKTCFSFRCPSQEVLDFTGQVPKTS